MIQFLVFFPVLYFIVKRYEFKGVCIALCINALYEFFQRIYFVNDELYRLLLFRYTSLIALGIYLALYPNKPIKPIVRLVIFFLGLSFILLTSYMGYSPKIITYWTGTCFIATFLIWDFCSRYFKMKNTIRFKPLEIVGKASYHIFLVQMVFYAYGVGLVYSVVPSVVAQLLVNIFICVIFGLVFYRIEDVLRKRIRFDYIYEKLSLN